MIAVFVHETELVASEAQVCVSRGNQ